MTRIPSICEWAWWIFMVRLQPSISRLRNYFSPLLLVIGSSRRFPILTLGRHEEARRNSNLFRVIDTIRARFIKYLLIRECGLQIAKLFRFQLAFGWKMPQWGVLRIDLRWLSVNAWIRLNIYSPLSLDAFMSCAMRLVTLIWSSLHGISNSGFSTSRSFANWTRHSPNNHPPTEKRSLLPSQPETWQCRPPPGELDAVATKPVAALRAQREHCSPEPTSV